MEILWAGWRSVYLAGLRDESDDAECLFCRLPDAGDDEAWIVERGKTAFTVLNLYPYTNGHLMIAPYRHAGVPAELSAAEREEVWQLEIRAQQALAEVFAPHGFNLGVNLGRAAGAGVLGHFHLHVVPRWGGDANFMTTTAHTRILPEPLADTWARLREAIAAR